MKPALFRFLARLPGPRLLCGLPLVASLGTLGCSAPEQLLARGVSDGPALVTEKGPVIHANPDRPNSPASHNPPPGPVIHTRSAPPGATPVGGREMLPAPSQSAAGKFPAQGGEALAAPSHKVLPIALDTIFRIAEEQNLQVAQSREKLNEYFSDKNLADLSWLPDVNVGFAYYRHEGGIQLQTGQLIHSSTGAAFAGMDLCAKYDVRDIMYQKLNAERRLWQQQSEVCRITSETWIDATATYIDLLAARESEKLLERMRKLEQEVLDWAEALFKTEKSAEVLVESARAAVVARKHAISQAQQQAEAAGAKLAFLLGLDPKVKLYPADAALKSIDAVPAHQPTEALVAQAMSHGPGVRELEEMLAVIQRGMDQSQGPGRFIPVVELHMLEGAFGAGPGASLNWDNRFDACLQFRWNLSDLCRAQDKLNRAKSQQQQAELGYRELQARLALGVKESQQVILAAKSQVQAAEDHIKHAKNHHRLAYTRLKERVEGSSTAEVLNAVRLLEAGEFAVLNAVRAHNKAQFRLLVLIGAAGKEHKGEPHKK